MLIAGNILVISDSIDGLCSGAKMHHPGVEAFCRISANPVPRGLPARGPACLPS